MFLRRTALRILRDGSNGLEQQAGQAQSQAPRIRSNLNKVQLIGTVGKTPKAFSFQGGGQKVSFPLATSEYYRGKDGQGKSVTEWHNIAVYQEKLGSFIINNITKGAQVYVEGSLSTSKYTSKDGQAKQNTEIRVSPFQGSIKILLRGAPVEQVAEETYEGQEGAQEEEHPY